MIATASARFRSALLLALSGILPLQLADVTAAQGNPLDPGGGSSQRGGDGEVDLGMPLVYSGDGLTVYLDQLNDDTGQGKGRMELSGQTFEFTGSFESELLFRGSFKAGGQFHPFTATANERDENLVLKTGRATYNLKPVLEPDDDGSDWRENDRQQARRQPQGGGAESSALVTASNAYGQQDYRRALEILQPLADKGHVGASFIVGVAAEYGAGQPRDEKKAARYYERAYEGQHPAAAFNLGILYRDGRGVPTNERRALELISKAAHWGDSLAMHDYGLILMNGYATQADLPGGLAWVNLSAARGNEDARRNLQDFHRDPSLNQTIWQRSTERQKAIESQLPADRQLDFLLDFDRYVGGLDGSSPSAVDRSRQGQNAYGGGRERQQQRGAQGNPFDRNGSGNADRRPRPARGGGSPAPSGSIKLEKVTLRDPGMDGMESHTLLKPTDWRLEGGPLWAPELYKSFVHMNLRVHGPEGQTVAVYPGAFYTHGQNNVQANPQRPGQIAEGAIYMPPPSSLSEYVTRILMPAQHPAARNVRVVESVVLPEVREKLRVAAEPIVVAARQASAEAMQMGYQTDTQFSFLSERVRITYEEQGQAYEEDLFVTGFVMKTDTLLQGFAYTVTNWTVEDMRAVRAPAGQLDQARPVLEAVVMSVRAEPRWLAVIAELSRRINQQQMDAIVRRGEINRQAREAAWNSHQASVAKQQESNDAMHHQFVNYLRDVDDYRGADGSSVSLPNQYSHVFDNGQGEYLLTNDPNFDPNAGSSQNWTAIQRQR